MIFWTLWATWQLKVVKEWACIFGTRLLCLLYLDKQPLELVNWETSQYIWQGMSVPETGTLQNQMGEHWHIDLLANIDILSLKSVQILTHTLQHCVHSDNCKCTCGWKKSQTDACKHWHGEGGDELWVKGEITTRAKGTKIYIVEKKRWP